MKLTFREYNDLDVDEMATIFSDTFSQDPWNEPWTFEKAKIRLLQLLQFSGQKSYIVQENDKLVGFCIGTIMNWHDSVASSLWV